MERLQQRKERNITIVDPQARVTESTARRSQTLLAGQRSFLSWPPLLDLGDVVVFASFSDAVERHRNLGVISI